MDKNIKKTYFISDLHLQAAALDNNKQREIHIVKWLDSIKSDMGALFLMGDIFDFWFEYKKVVPKGSIRFLGKLAELADQGIEINYYTGNHDIWAFDYLEKEIGVNIYRKENIQLINGKKFFLAHGDGLGPFDKSYKLLKKIFTNKFLQWAFARIHPNFAFFLAHSWSKQSRLKNKELAQDYYKGDDKEWLTLFAKDYLNKEHIDYFIFGHRHVPHTVKLNDKSTYINTGDWILNFTYVVFNGEKAELKSHPLV
ncbi:MAG: UDP-2,3-diacylglucosamine diphosphatase [Marinifilaceae bacterium]|jgi:UDP-2,3-diacylglucosamine hydrolase|nr:UDP-2,3-diacylglucosamine diphosphatase [Marinifilaceae bacterium]